MISGINRDEGVLDIERKIKSFFIRKFGDKCFVGA
jgi:hypothetical protein